MARSVFISASIIHASSLPRSSLPLAYVRGMADGRSFWRELRGRLWSNHFGWQSLFHVGHAAAWEHWTKSRPADHSLTGHPMSFDRLKRTQSRKRLPGHKLKPSRATLFVQNSQPHLSMKPTYFLGIDAAKHKMRAALSNQQSQSRGTTPGFYG